MLYNLASYKTINEFKYDVIFIGAGASGLVCAKELSNKKPNLKIAILESGGLKKNKQINKLDSNIANNQSINFKNSTARYFGGKTNRWAGRVIGVGEDELNYWPISKKEILFWRDKALKHLVQDYSIENLYNDSDRLFNNDVNQFFGNQNNLMQSFILDKALNIRFTQGSIFNYILSSICIHGYSTANFTVHLYYYLSTFLDSGL